MPIRCDFEHLGRASISPDTPVVAAQFGTWTLTYVVGKYGYDERARLMIGQRFPCDAGLPQFDKPAEPGYTTVRLETKSPSAKLKLSNEERGQARPYFRCLTLAVAAGSLYEGDRIVVTMGDTSGGSPGLRAQTYREKGLEWKFFVDPFGTEVYNELPAHPMHDVVGGALHRLVVVAPTTVRANEPFDALVKAEDLWGNPCERCTAKVSLRAEGGNLAGLPKEVTFESGTLAVARLKGLTLASGEVRIAAQSGESATLGNAIKALGKGEPKTWWSDMHGQTRYTVGTGTFEEYYAFARDVALLDFTTHQGNDFQIDTPRWKELIAVTKRFNEDGRFAALAGYEWSGMTPGGGDRNVVFRGEDVALHRSSHAEVADTSDADGDCFPLSELYERFRGRKDVLLIPHIGGRYADIVNYFDPTLESVVEIYSAWGRFEWLIEDAFKKGLKVGFTANSDDHKGRTGASHPGAGKFGMYGGLTCVLAENLTREAIFDALKARRCYACGSGQRILIDLSVNGLPVGAEGQANGEVTIKGRVAGTGPIARIDFFRGLDQAETLTPYAARDFEASNRYRVEWSGSRVRGRDRIAVWDGHLSLSAGKILDAAPYAFVNPDKGVAQASDTEVRWTSVTTGGDNGVDLTLDAPASAKIAFHSPIKDAEFALAGLKDDKPVRVAAGGIDLEIRARRLPAGGQQDVLEFEKKLSAPASPWSAYWIRVTQEDGAQAWTSPVYLSKA